MLLLDSVTDSTREQGRQGYFIRAYRNLTSVGPTFWFWAILCLGYLDIANQHNASQEMIADLKADSARWEQDVAHRANQGYPRGSYIHDYSMSHAPNMASANYATSSIHEGRQQQGPSPQMAYSAAPSQTYGDPYVQSGYPQTQSPPYPNPSSYPTNHSPFGASQNPYPPPQIPFSAPSQPPVSGGDMHGSYTYTTAPNPYGYEGRSGAPRYPGPGYDADSDYSPVTSGIAYPATTAPDARIGGMERFTPESAYSDRSRPQPTRERGDAPRRPR